MVGAILTMAMHRCRNAIDHVLAQFLLLDPFDGCTSSGTAATLYRSGSHGTCVIFDAYVLAKGFKGLDELVVALLFSSSPQLLVKGSKEFTKTLSLYGRHANVIGKGSNQFRHFIIIGISRTAALMLAYFQVVAKKAKVLVGGKVFVGQ
jgi:hypothetical protein